MNISFKYLIFSFILFTIVFSLILGFICVGIFNSRVSVIEKNYGTTQESEKITIHKNVIFKCENGNELDFFVLTMLDKVNKTVFLSFVDGDYLTDYKNNTGVTYVKSAYSLSKDTALIEITKAFSSLNLNKDDVYTINCKNFSEFMSNFDIMYLNNQDVFSDIFQCDKNGSDFILRDFDIILKTDNIDGTLKKIYKINIEETIKKFKNFLN